jgi:hypothetical protein
MGINSRGMFGFQGNTPETPRANAPKPHRRHASAKAAHADGSAARHASEPQQLTALSVRSANL